MILLLVYVDDIVIATDDDELYQETLAGLKVEYELTESVDVSWVLGWHVVVSSSGIFVSQTSFASSLLSKFGMLDSNAVCTPGVTDNVTPDPRGPRDAIAFTPTHFREAVGSLLFLTNCTRPDIAFAVNMVCRAMSDPSIDDWMRVKRILRYLVGTTSLGLWFRHQDSIAEGKPLLFAFSDSDWAGDPIGRRSTSGYVCFVAGAPVAWSSRKQSVVALSTMEAEYIAMASVARETMSLRALLLELGFHTSDALVLCDNSPAIFLAENSVVTPKSKHIDIRYHFLRDICQRGLLSFKWIPSGSQVADVFTKYLQRELFQRCVERLMGFGGCEE